MLTLLLIISVGGVWAQNHKNEGTRKVTPAPEQTQVTDKQLPPDAIAPTGYTPAAVPQVEQAVDAKTQKAMENVIEMVEVDGKMMPVPPKADRSAPSNDAVTGAWRITHGIMPVTRFQNASEATNNDGCINYIDFPGYSGDPVSGMNDGVWYKFHPNTDEEYTITVDPDGWNCEISVFWTHNPNPTLSDLHYKANIDAGGSGDTEVLTLNLYAASTYYINIGYYHTPSDGAEGPFSLKIEGPQGNDRRENAIVVTPAKLPYSVYQDASNATNNDGCLDYTTFLEPPASGGMNDGVWYKFTPEVSGFDYTITVSPTGWDAEIGVFYRVDDQGPWYYKGHKDASASGGTESITLRMNSVATYYINIGHFNATVDHPEGPFTLKINYVPPANDDCDNPISIPSSPLPYSHTQYDAAGATGGIITYSDWGGPTGGMNDGVWYRFDPANNNIDYTIQVQPYNNWDPEIALFYGLCNSWIYKTHADRRGRGGMEEVVFKFEIFVVPTPENDNCSGAIAISPATLPYTHTQDANGATNITNPETGETHFITYGDYGGPAGGMNDGVWYTFTPDISGSYTMSANPNGWDAEISVFSGDCTNLVYIDHADDPETLTLDLTASTTYYINIGYYHMSKNKPEGEFTLSLQRNSTAVTGVTLSPSSANLTVGETQQLTATVQPSNASNTNVSWSTSNSSIVTVNSSGLITAVSPGNATVIVNRRNYKPFLYGSNCR